MKETPMKIKGKNIAPPKPVTVPIPRMGEEDIIIQCGAILDYTEFEKIYPDPKPPAVMRPGKPTTYNREDKGFLAAVDKQYTARIDWMIIKSLESTPDLTWDTVDLNNPETYSNIHKEMAAVFTPSQCNQIIDGVFAANVSSGDRQVEALARFQRLQAEAAKLLTSDQEGHGFTQPGTLANDSESARQESQNPGTT